MKIKPEKRIFQRICFAQIAFLTISVCASITSEVDAQLRKNKSKEEPTFIVPPDEDPAAFSPAQWGLVKKGTQPDLIPSLEQPSTTYTIGPRPDYVHTTSIGKYKAPELNSQVVGPVVGHAGGQLGEMSVLEEVLVQGEPAFGSIDGEILYQSTTPYMTPASQADPNVVPRLPFLRMTAAEAAYQPSPYHVKPESPSFKEVMSTGAWFASYESMFLHGHFQGNTGLTIDTPTFGLTRDFNFDFEHAPVVRFGFESKKGPGSFLKYWELDADSDTLTATSDGTSVITSSIWLAGPRRHSVLTASNPGEYINATHRQWITSLEAMFFKEIKMPISRINGLLGFRYIQVHHRMTSHLFDAGGNCLGLLSGTHYFRGFGPKLGFDYYRPIGHTQIEFLGGMNTALMFGHRDQTVYNTQSADFSQFPGNEILSVTEAQLGAQWVREWGQKYRLFIRGTINGQIWYGGGTASDPNRDFGLYGVTIGAGLNH